VLLLAALPDLARAVPAAPVEHELRQVDGATFKAVRWGDENRSGWDTAEGYAILQNDLTGEWLYAEHDAGGNLRPTKERVGRGRSPLHGVKRMRPLGAARETLRHRGISRKPAKASSSAASGTASPAATAIAPVSFSVGNLPVILVNFSDTATSFSAADFTSLLFGTDVWSMRDYYNEVSYGKFTVSPGPAGVVGWYTAANGHDYYGSNYLGEDRWPGDLVYEAVQAADATVDFSAYDQNGDCFVDVVNIVHQGTGEEASSNARDIWSHSWSLADAMSSGFSHYGVYTTNDLCQADPGQFVKINDYVIQPEKYGAGISTMGVFAHEYGHALGLPDLYDTDYSSEGIGTWSLMAGGSWNKVSRSGDRPAHLDAWSRYALGWSVPVKVTSSQANQPLAAVESGDACFQFRDGSPASGHGEYFLLENRQKTGFDAGLPGEGLLLWHVDESIATDNNKEWYPGCSSCTSHYKVALIQADNLYHLEKNVNGGESGDPYPGSTNNFSVSTATSPATNLYSGAGGGFAITDISPSAALMYASFVLPDTTPPVTTITGTPPLNSSAGSFTFSANEPATFACKIDSASYAACSSPYGFSGLADGSHTFTVRATDLAGNPETVPPSYTWTIDTTRHTLTVQKNGTGSGTVTAPAGVGSGINCGSQCAETYLHGVTVVLTAAASSSSSFTGWSDSGCPGSATCTITMNDVKTVTATFTANPVNGVCGISNGGTFTTAPSIDLCTSGITSGVSGSGPWSWSCNGEYGGTTAACSAAIQTYSVVFQSGGNGSLTGSASQTIIYGHSATTVTAVPAVGYHFVNWTGTNGFATTTANPLTVTNVTADQTITANFAIDTFSITFASGGNGSLSGDLSQTVNYGASATAVTAVPVANYHFVNWTGSGGFVTTTANPLTVTNVTAAQAIIANFAIDQYTVTAVPGTNGTLDSTTPSPVNVNHGATASFKFNAATGYYVSGVSGCGGSDYVNSNQSVTSYTYTTGAISGACTVSAVFAVKTYGVSFASGGNGTLSGDTSQTVNYGASASAVTAVPATNYHFVNWTGSGGFVSTANPLTVTNVTAAQAIIANFAIDQYTVTAAPGTNGTLDSTTPSPVNVNHGATASFKFNGATGYYVSGVSGCGGSDYVNSNQSVTSYSYSTGAISGICTVSAVFAVKTYGVSFASGGNGSLSGDTSQTVNYGASATAVTAVPSANYHFVNWTGTGGFVSTANPLTVANITAAKAITANFAIDTYSVTFASGGNGSLSGDTSQTVSYGASATAVTAVPAVNYHFVNWTGTGGFVSTANPLTVTNVTSSQAIIATFVHDPVNGVCGSSNGSIFTTAPTANLCSSGTITRVNGTGPWSWSCIGQYGGTTASCSAAIQKFTVTFTSGGNGSLTGTASQIVKYGAAATAVTAVADAGYHFVSWTGSNGFASTENPLTVAAVTANMTIIATFGRDAVNGACGSSSGGVFTAAPTTNLCTSGVASGVSGSGPWNWSCNGQYGGTTAPCSAAIQKFTVTFQSGGNGSLTGSTSQAVNYGSSATAVTAVPAANYHFVNWTGTNGFAATTANPLTVANVTAAQAITATFAHDPVNGACGGSNGAIFTAAPTTGLCASGSASGVSGSGPWSWSCSGQYGGSAASCSADIQTFTITFQSGGNGSLTGSATQIVNYGSSTATVTAVPASGYHFVSWTGTNGFAATTANPLTVTNVTAAQAITASFAHDPVNGVCGSSSGGVFTAPPTAGLCASGSASLLNGSGPWNWSCSGEYGGSAAACSASLQTYAVTFQSGGNGTLTGSTSQTVNHGASTAAVTAVPAASYHFVGWTGTNGFATTTANPLTMANVTTNMTITATFAHDPVNGACGSSSGGIFTVAPTANLCSSGSVSGVSGSGPWSWSCSGEYGGSAASCAAAIQTYTITFQGGDYGSLAGSASQTVNHGASTAAVTAVPAANYHFGSWSGSGGFVTTTANPLTVPNVTANMTITASFVHDPVNGVCGSSSGGVFTVPPATGLCSSGPASAVTGTGTVTWSCGGAYDGASATCSATVDTTAPSLTVVTLANGVATNRTPVSISGTVSDANGIASLTINGTAVVVAANGSYQYALPLAAEGAVAITVIATDKAGNSASDSRTLTYDNTLPVITVTGPADSSQTREAVVTVTGSVSEAASVQGRIGAGSWQSAQLSGTAFTLPFALVSGQNIIEISATDQAGNRASSVTRTILYDPNSPLVAIIDPAHDIQVHDAAITVKGTVADQTGTFVKLSFNGNDYAPVVTSGQFQQALTIPAEGSYAVTVTATDAVGNPPTTVSRNIIYAPYPGGNGYSLADILKVFRYDHGLTTLTPAEKLRFDCAPLGADGRSAPDGVVDGGDVILLLRRYVGMVNWQ
jgi:M6 family metalloprotease-like protein/uncharacterized repeat protein (TIGR02543 family)